MSSRHDVIVLPPPIGGPGRVFYTATATTAASVSLWNPPRTITSSTDATPIVVTLAAAGHGFVNGDSVTISGHTTNVAANGTWVLASVGATTVTLVGSVGSGAGAGASGSMVFSDDNYARPSSKVWVHFETETNDAWVRFGSAQTAGTTLYNGVHIRTVDGAGSREVKFYLTPSIHTNVDVLAQTGAGILRWYVCSPPGERERI